LLSLALAIVGQAPSAERRLVTGVVGGLLIAQAVLFATLQAALAIAAVSIALGVGCMAIVFAPRLSQSPET
jgi:hypothetical protein